MAIIFAFSTVAMLFLFLFLFSLTIFSNRIFIKLPLPNNVTSPYYFAFDQLGRGPYTGVTEGLQLGLYQQHHILSKEVCDGTRDISLGPICGRPLVLGHDHSSNQLYIANAYFGLSAVGSNGGLATQAAIIAAGVSFRFLSGLDFGRRPANRYSLYYILQYWTRAKGHKAGAGNATVLGPTTGSQVTVLLRNLSEAVGTALSSDRLLHSGGRV